MHGMQGEKEGEWGRMGSRKRNVEEEDEGRKEREGKDDEQAREWKTSGSGRPPNSTAVRTPSLITRPPNHDALALTHSTWPLCTPSISRVVRTALPSPTHTQYSAHTARPRAPLCLPEHSRRPPSPPAESCPADPISPLLSLPWRVMPASEGVRSPWSAPLPTTEATPLCGPSISFVIPGV